MTYFACSVFGFWLENRPLLRTLKDVSARRWDEQTIRPLLRTLKDVSERRWGDVYSGQREDKKQYRKTVAGK